MRLSALLVLPVCASAVREEHAANPIRKVVNMLQMMQKKVEAEGEKEKELFEKFMCYCKNSGSDLAKSIADAGDAIPELGSNIEAAEGQLVQLKEDLKKAQTDRAAAKTAMAEATAIREKDHAAYQKESGDLKTNLDAMNKAVKALSLLPSAASSALLQTQVSEFLQTRAAAVLKKIVLADDKMSDIDRHDVTAFLTNDMDTQNMAEVIGILKQMADTMEATLGDVVSKEEAAVKTYEELIKAKKEEIEALTGAIEEKTVRIGELGVEIVQMKNDLGDTQESLVADKKFVAELEKNCATKEKEWAVIQKTRSEEVLAIADTIKILNDDDALEMFKKTLPGASSFMQLEESDSSMRSRALALLQDAKNGKKSNRQRIDFIMLMIRGKKVGFDKVLKMIDNMVALLKEEQVEDDSKKEYCETSFDQTEDKMKELERAEGKLETAISEAKESITTFKEEIAALGEGLKELDKSVKDATEQRQEENSDHKTLMINNQAAKELLEFAKNRLNKFYNPKLYKPPSFVQISMHNNEAPPPPPEAPGAYKKNSEGGNGVIAMIDGLIKELDTEMTESETNEKLAQEDYEEMMKDSSEKRTADTKALAEKESALADAEDLIVNKGEELTSTQKELMAVHEYMGQLHGECDWILKFFDVRKQAREGEIDALGKAKAVLSGADFSLVQTKSRRFLRHQ
jgi:DNA repair exonuclease SbcCD ATPase subunit